MKSKKINKEFLLKIILPTLLVFAIFTTLIFSLIIPSIKSYMLDGKREMIKELTNSAWSVLDELDSEISDGLLTLEEAQKEAIFRIEIMRYGNESKDYFWITDMHPLMIMHPYRRDLNKTDLSNYKDPTGKKLFVEFRDLVDTVGEGYVDYMWQWKDDSTRIVPKLSFVKGFNKWGWVIGTGIYIEDVNEEISSITGDLLYISVAILLLLGFILFFIGKQSLMIESNRHAAEVSLRESEAKYKALVEASNDGLVMMLEGEYIYSNQALLILLGYESEVISSIELTSVLTEDSQDENSAANYFSNLANGAKPQDQYHTKLKRVDGKVTDVILYTSKISFGLKEGLAIIVKDISTHKQIEEELDLNKEKFLSLAGNINVGVFRAEMNSHGKIIEANKSAAEILGYSKATELNSIGLFDLFHNVADRKTFIKKLMSEGSIKDNIIQVKKQNASTSIVSISAAYGNESTGVPEYFDGTIDDITDRFRQEEDKERLIVELQTSLRFLNQPIEHFVRHTVDCNMHMPIYQVAKAMNREKYSAALIKTDEDEYVGIITDHDLRRRVVAENLNLENPIFEVMSSPLRFISSSSLVFEAFLLMNEQSTRHLAVKNHENKFIGIISSEELILVQRNSTSYILREIENSENVEELITARRKVPTLVKALVDSGARCQLITHIITSIFEAITEKLISFAIVDLGEPPVEFEFIALGSVGREEQTLFSDQDNAIIYSDVSNELAGSTHLYFHSLGTKVCNWLNECGYAFCEGEAMAKNPKWCQSISQWEKYFHSWVKNSNQQDLIDLSIFFDFRSIYGKSDLSDRLRTKISKVLDGQAGFFQHLTKNCLLHKPPIGLLRKIVVESKGKHSDKFDIKLAIMPIIDFARIYGLKNNIISVNSTERLNDLLKMGLLNRTTYEELKQAYNNLMQIRLKQQANQITTNQHVDNYINPTSLTQIEQNTLKNIFTQIISIQKKLSYDFSGEAI